MKKLFRRTALYGILLGLMILAAGFTVRMTTVDTYAAEKQTGWVTKSGNRYYYDQNGKLYKGLKKVDGKWYYFNESTGAAYSGYLKYGNGNQRYFAYANHQMVTGWMTQGSSVRYFDLKTGLMYRGLKKIDGKWYFFNESTGAAYSGYLKYGNGNQRYFAYANYQMVTGWMKQNSGLRYFDLSTGLMYRGLKKIDGSYYYFDTSTGAAKSGWQGSGTYKRYFDKNTYKMVTGTQKIDGKTYTFTNTGRLAQDLVHTSKITKDTLDILNLDKYDKLMIVAHPDDETLWGGDHLLKGNYLVVCLTNGYATYRLNEFTSALKMTGDKGIIMDYPDLTNGKRNNWSSCKSSIISDIQTVMNYKNWSEIATHNPDGEYGHIHHKMTSSSVTSVAKSLGYFSRLQYFGIYYTRNKLNSMSQKPNALSSSDYAKKNKVANVYVSQNVQKNWGQMIQYENWISASNWN